jgi:pectinesterase
MSWKQGSGSCSCVFILCIAVVVLVVAAAAAISVPIILVRMKHENQLQLGTMEAAISLACNATRFPVACNVSLSAVDPRTFKSSAKDLTTIAVTAATQAVSQTLSSSLSLMNMSENSEISGINATLASKLVDCFPLLNLSLGLLDESFYQLDSSSMDLSSLHLVFQDIKTWISGALTFYTTCTDAFNLLDNSTDDDHAAAFNVQIQQQSEVTFQLLSNALSFVNALALFGNDLRSWKPSFFQTHVQSVTTTAAAAAVTPAVPSTTPPAARRKLLASENREQPTAVLTHPELTISFPTWLSPADRRLLLAVDSWSANVTVAQDGSGDYNTIQQAVDAAAAAASSSSGNSNSSSSKPAAAALRYVIHIKEGIYHEIVRVSTPFLTMLGDGINKTIITGNRSATDPSMTTYQSATFGVTGKGFIAKGITFQNTAGAIAHQAVALRVSGDQSAFWQCSFDGFQDTLYTHALRQFYFGCTIYGTVDFVFGNAAAVLQNCTLLARPNLQGQENVYTAQGRTDPGQNTGFVLADCIIGGTPDLLPQSQLFPTFLGRPWKLYSLTVYINSTISGIVNPSGWLPWSGNFALDTLYFAEYESQGPGANPQARVNWSTQITDPSELAKFSVNNFLNAQEWLLPDTSR